MNRFLPPKVNIIGIGITNFTLNDAIQVLNSTIDANLKIRACVTPINCLVWAQRDTILKKIYNSADITFCDGVPILWISKFLRTPIKERITGLDLLPKYTKECNTRGYTMFLLGAKEGVANKLKEKFEVDYPQIKIVGVYSPPFAKQFSLDENSKMIKMINDVKPNVLWVSLTAPKQDFWLYENFSQLDVNVAIGVGGAFEVSANLVKRAPVWVQKIGFEWFYRFSKEPLRLFKRYFIEAPVIVPYVLSQKYGSKQRK